MGESAALAPGDSAVTSIATSSPALQPEQTHEQTHEHHDQAEQRELLLSAVRSALSTSLPAGTPTGAGTSTSTGIASTSSNVLIVRALDPRLVEHNSAASDALLELVRARFESTGRTNDDATFDATPANVAAAAAAAAASTTTTSTSTAADVVLEFTVLRGLRRLRIVMHDARAATQCYDRLNGTPALGEAVLPNCAPLVIYHAKARTLKKRPSSVWTILLGVCVVVFGFGGWCRILGATRWWFCAFVSGC